MQSQHCDLLCEEESEEEAKGPSKMLALFYFFFSTYNKFYWEEIHLKPAMHMPSSAIMC